jgi:hypothetical protein
VTLTVSFPFVGTSAFYTGTATSTLVPEIFPVAINGRPYMVDVKSGEFTRQFDQRVRDSQDTSTAPGESAISPQGLWRRGQNSWHFGAGQKYSDTADAQDFRFYKSKGVDVWTKGQLTLLNGTKLSLASSATSSNMVVQDGRVYVSLNGDVKYTTDPYASSPTWSDCTGEPGGTCNAMATNGDVIYFGFANDGIRKLDPAVSISAISGSKFINTTDNYTMLGFAKGYMFGAHDHQLRNIQNSGSNAVVITPFDTAFTWVGVATGQNAVYAAGYAQKKSLIYKITIKSDGTLDTGSVALELPTGEVVTAISGYLGNILIGTNKGVRYCSTDSNSNLIAGALIPTSGDVKKFTSNGKFTWFTWSNYDGTSTGLGRLDLSTFIAPNTPAFATDLMYTSTANVLNVVTFNDKHCFVVSGVGVVAEDSDNLVASGTLETGLYQWGIPDRKFAPRVDIRVEPLVGSISAEVQVENAGFTSIGIHSDAGDTEHTFLAPEAKFITAGYRFTLTRATAVTGPTLIRWMSRAYAAPTRSRLISVPVLIHERHSINNKDYYFDVALERDLLEELVANPTIITYQEKDDQFSVIVEDCRWIPRLVSGTDWLWEGTMVVIMRTITE